MNSQPLIQTHHVDYHGNPKGGETLGTGIYIRWQEGGLVETVQRPVANPRISLPVAESDQFRLQPNGAFVETVIEAAIGRLQHYQDTRFFSIYNHDAIGKLHEALEILASRTAERTERGVEGTHEV